MCAANAVCMAANVDDSVLLNRVWNYRTHLRKDVAGKECKLYMSYTFHTIRENVMLQYLPTMSSIAKGDGHFTGEVYGTLTFRDKFDYDFNIQAEHSTIPKGGRPITPLFNILVPVVYGEHFYEDRLLSPFHRNNRLFYRYTVDYLTDSTARIVFKPRIKNTQLVDGHAVVNSATGAIQSMVFVGEFDMLSFTTSILMRPNSSYGLPLSSNMKVQFNCLGNNVEADVTYVYNMPQDVADSIMVRDTVPVDSNVVDTSAKKHYWYDEIKHIAMDKLNDSASLGSGKAYVGVSPLLNPTYMGYSLSKGLSLKVTLYTIYEWEDHRSLSFDPSLGYYTKKNQWYYSLPLTLNYSPERNGKVGFVWANGNRISNPEMEEVFNNNVGHDTISMPEFRDEYFQLFNNIGVSDWVQFTVGIDYHIRDAMGKENLLEQAGLLSTYRSFAPYFTVLLLPWQERGPVFSGNVERSFRDILGSNLKYCRYEFDAQYKLRLHRMRRLNFHSGAGFYTTRNSVYFVDYTNFRDNNLPTGWDDEWSGQFQLVNSRLYNVSNYYIRGHIFYESPLLALSWIPAVGSFIESERLYFSALKLEDRESYNEIGYGFRCKYFSAAIFASFLNWKFDAIECKFTLELFNRW